MQPMRFMVEAGAVAVALPVAFWVPALWHVEAPTLGMVVTLITGLGIGPFLFTL